MLTPNACADQYPDMGETTRGETGCVGTRAVRLFGERSAPGSSRFRRARYVTLTLVLPLLFACGSAVTPRSSLAGSPAPTDLPVVMHDGQVEVGCGGPEGWPPSVMAHGLSGVLTVAEVTDAFTELLANPKYSGELSLSFLKEGPLHTDWRVLRADGNRYTLGLGRWTATGPHRGASVFTMQRQADAWLWNGGGDCHLAPVLKPGNGWVRLSLPTTGIDRSVSSPEVGVSEEACSGARDVRPYLHAPVVQETSKKVTVYWTSTPPSGVNSCVGASPVDVPLPLSSPLGNRKLLDGSSWPPARVVQPRY